MQEKLNENLARVFPINAVDEIASIIVSNGIKLRISRPRKSKNGDFRASSNGSLHKISINGNLDKDSSLLVFLHEFSHLVVWEKYRNKVSPHGNEWKKIFGLYLQNFVTKGYFRPELEGELMIFSTNVKAAGFGSLSLARKLLNGGKDEINIKGKFFVEDIPENSLFATSNGRLFRKGSKLKKRFLCYCLDNQRSYLFQPMAKVKLKARPTENN